MIRPDAATSRRCHRSFPMVFAARAAAPDDARLRYPLAGAPVGSPGHYPRLLNEDLLQRLAEG